MAAARACNSTVMIEVGGEATDRLMECCVEKLGDPTSWKVPDGYPKSLALCVLDAVWSLNANYDRHVLPVLGGYRELRRAAGADPGADTASDLLAAIRAVGGPERFATEVGNRQRTATHSGAPLKADAVVQAAEVLVRAGIETPSDLAAAVAGEHAELKRSWRQVPGQRSSDVGWRYLLLLAGSDQVKPDRMVRRFVAAALGRADVTIPRQRTCWRRRQRDLVCQLAPSIMPCGDSREVAPARSGRSPEPATHRTGAVTDPKVLPDFSDVVKWARPGPMWRASAGLHPER